MPIKVCIEKAMAFSVLMYGCESWTTEKANTEELMLLNRGVGEDLRVPWTARKSNQSIPKEINPEYSSRRTDAEVEAPILCSPDAKS